MGECFLNQSGGGGSLNFKVKDYATEELLMAATGKDNEIGIITSTPMTGWYMAAEQPEGMQPGEVYIKTGTSSTVAFNALKKNNIQVYPLSATQYVGGAMVSKEAKIYQNGAWVELNGLPSEYQEVEYIQTTGTQYITTDIKPSDNTYQVETKIKTTTSEDNEVVFAGASPRYYSLTMFVGKWFVGGNNTETSGGVSSAAPGNTYEIVFNDANHDVTINGATVVSGQSFFSDQPIRIAMRLSDNTSGIFKYYYFRIKNNSTGKILADLVPCYRKVDSVAGMYDLVSKKFYTNSGTGTFIVGGDVQ